MRHRYVAPVIRFVPIIRAFFLALPAALAVHASSAADPDEQTYYQEQSKLIRSPNSFARLGDDLFGDKVNLYTGSLEFIQTDVSLTGNSSLPVSVGRRLVVGQAPVNGTLFGRWDLEIPHLHGIFAASTGWSTGSGRSIHNRCTSFGAPPLVRGSNDSFWDGTEYWHGNFLYIPRQGDQEMLRRNNWFGLAPHGASPDTYPIVTRNKWTFRCLPSLHPANGMPGEGAPGVSAANGGC